MGDEWKKLMLSYVSKPNLDYSPQYIQYSAAPTDALLSLYLLRTQIIFQFQVLHSICTINTRYATWRMIDVIDLIWAQFGLCHVKIQDITIKM